MTGVSVSGLAVSRLSVVTCLGVWRVSDSVRELGVSWWRRGRGGLLCLGVVDACGDRPQDVRCAALLGDVLPRRH